MSENKYDVPFMRNEAHVNVDLPEMYYGDITIDSHVKLPRSKAKVKRETATQKGFNAYAAAYERVYIRKPVLQKVSAEGMVSIDVLPQAVSLKRLKELTSMLKERAKDL